MSSLRPQEERSEPARLIGIAAVLAISAAVLARVALLLLRDPFFDELFTLWIASKPLGEILEALRSDSGPPAYYVLVRALYVLSAPSVIAARAISCLAGVVGIVMLAADRRAGRSAILGALLLAFFPPHFFFSTEARAYALCGLLSGGAALALDRWSEGRPRALGAAVALLLAAAYTHYYGALFFPAVLVVAALKRDRNTVRHAAIATAALAIGFIPGFFLAASQPPAALGWISPVLERPLSTAILTPPQLLGFAGPYPAVFTRPAPLLLSVVSLAASIAALIGTRSARAIRFAAMTLTPIVAMWLLALSGRFVYFPFRFESVLAIPFVVWLAEALQFWRVPVRVVILGVLLILGVVFASFSLRDAAQRPLDPYPHVAEFVARQIPPRTPLVASGAMYLQLETRIADAEVVAFPRSQAVHPGWREDVSMEVARRELAALDPMLPARFIWCGPIGTAEFEALRERYRLRPLFGDVGVFAVEVRKAPGVAQAF